jgi:hypothetical protein
LGFVIFVLLCAALSLFTSVAHAASIDRVQLGFDGAYKLGYWTPLAVQVSGLPDSKNLSLEVVVPDSDGVPTRVRHPFTFSSRLSSVPPPDYSTTPTRRLCVKVGRNTGQMVVVLRDGDRELARRTFELDGGELAPALPSESWLVLSLGATKHLADTLAANKRFKGVGGRVVTITQAADLPSQWYGYEGVDAVVISGSAAEAPKLLARRDAPGALDAWLRRGGTLLMTLGGGGETLLTPGSPLAAWAPGQFERTVDMTDAGALEGATDVKSPLEPLVQGPRFQLNAARLSNLKGDVKLKAAPEKGNVALIVDRHYGFGRVLFLAIDLDEPLLGKWTPTGPLIASWLLPSETASVPEEARELGAVAHAGYDDLAGQLRSALDQFGNQGVRLLPFGALMGLMLAYIALLGPGDFFLVKRLLRRMELTWVTLPLLIVITCGGAYALAVSLKGRDVRMNQLDIVDYDIVDDEAQQTRRATSYFTLFSPRGRAYNVSIEPPGANKTMPTLAPTGPAPVTPTDATPLVSWFGLPGTALGGMESRAVPPLTSRPYDYALKLDALDEVPVPIWSTKSLMARWMPRGAAPLTAKLVAAQGASQGMLTGTVVNNLEAPLVQCLLLTKEWVYPLGTLAAKERIAIREDLGPIATSSHLMRLREADEQYDLKGTELGRIVEVMSFYETVGGPKYTRLSHRYEAALDLSRQLGPDRAVLIGALPEAVVQVRNGDHPLSPHVDATTIYRIIVPIHPNP